MGLLACDITGNGVVMSSDSQDVVLSEGRVEAVGVGGHRKKDKVIRLAVEHFSALMGYVGTEEIGGVATRSWLERFIDLSRDASGVDEFCTELARVLTAAWKEGELDTCLWVFIAGYDRDGDGPYFWYVVNTTGFDPSAATPASRASSEP
jgi:hypothetical protein